MTNSVDRFKRVALLSTFYENIGDDLIRAGVVYQLRHFLESNPKFLHITKSNQLSRFFPVGRMAHSPVQRMPETGRRWTQMAGGFLPRIPLAHLFDKVQQCDLFVVAGTPVFYFVGGRSFLENERIYSEDWPSEIFDKNIDHHEAAPLVALGLGSIYEGEPESILRDHPRARGFLARFLRRARFVTARDAATGELLRKACPERNHIIHQSTCPSLWAGASFGVRPRENPEGRQALLGFSLESASWSRYANAAALRTRAADWIIEYFRKRDYGITLVAHNDLDVLAQSELARRHNLGAPLAPDAAGLLREARAHQIAVTWRVHGAVAALSMGTPAILFRTDSRYQLAAGLGAEILDDMNLEHDRLAATLDRICAETGADRAARISALDHRMAAETETLRPHFSAAFAA